MTRFYLRMVVVILMGIGLAGCGESYRYKLTLAVNTPEGIKRGSSVVEVDFWSANFPVRGGIGHRLRGEALYLDLGAGKPGRSGKLPRVWSPQTPPLDDHR
jgi:hypothetical protein